MIALLFDTETTGLLENHTMRIDRLPHVIEYYSCLADLDTGDVLEEIDLLVRPPIKISDEITGITGISNEMVEAAPPFSEVAPRIKLSLEAAPIVVAHNLSFDMEMITVEMERIGDKIKWPRRRLCTVEQTIHLLGYRLNLSGLHMHLFNEEFKGAHRAKVDVTALLRCCVELRKRNVI